MTVPVLTAARTERAGAPTLVLGPSLGTTTRLWSAAIPLLAPHFDILAVDLPGHGASRAATEPFSTGELADAVARVAALAGVERFYYAGDSLGGQLALELALRHPEKAIAVSIICSAAKVGEPAAWLERAATVRSQGTPVLVGPSAGRWYAPGFIEKHPELVGAMLIELSDTDDESYALCCEALAGCDLRSRLTEIDVPVLALWGALDVVIPPADARAVAEGVRRGRGIELAGVAHLAPAESPAEVAQALIEFFSTGPEHGTESRRDQS
ncbi:alpha/beta fold hydrolase [Parafrigoribacterium soli]|uniref:alpha/beta fold hydrolase n=1 Tax=Parafrigoribacterium soli TaxID=3144663 RepID=UPI0032EE37AB